MARAETVSVTVRFPLGVMALLDDAVKRDMFVSTSDAVRSLVLSSLMMANPDMVRGPMNTLTLMGEIPKVKPSTAIENNTNNTEKESKAEEKA